MRRTLVAAATALAALACAAPALADTGPLPQVVPLAPADGLTVPMSGAERDAPTLSWRVDFPVTPPAVTMMVHVLSDQTFTSGGGWVHTPTCTPSGLSCTGSVKLNGSWFLSADTCRHSPQPPSCATRPKGYVDFWWRVSVSWPGYGYVYSQPLRIRALVPPDRDGDGVPDATDNCPRVRNASQVDTDRRTRRGDACEPDRAAPRVALRSTSVRRGGRARIAFRMADNRGFVRVQATLAYHGRVLIRGAKTFPAALWSDVYYFWFDVPGVFPIGGYQACLRVTDRAGNARKACTTVSIR